MILHKNLGPHVKSLVSISLVAALSYFAAVIGIKLLEFIEPDEIHVSATAAGNNKGGGNGQKINAKKIADLHIFGDAAKKQAPKKPKKAKPKKVAPRTKLKLNLTGILLPTENDEGYALIKNKAKKSAVGVYRVGDKVVGDSVLKELYVDHIIIRHDGRNESLWLTRDEKGWKGVSFDFSGDSEGKDRFPEDDLPTTKSSSSDSGREAQQSNSSSSDDNRQKSQPSSSSSSAPEPDKDSGDDSGGPTVTDATEEMEQLRQGLGELDPEVLRDLRPSFRPHIVKGRLQGYLISRYGPYRDLLLAHGLRVGDVITKVNDIPLTHSVGKRLLENKGELIEAGSLDLHVVRGGRKLPMTLRF